MRPVVNLLLLSLLAAGCVVATDEPTEDVSSASDALKPKSCPAIAVLCVEGYTPKQLPNCNAICVPDSGWECSDDADCGAIYCVTTPCPQPVCLGHQCTTLPQPPATGGQPCGDTHCGAGMYCCNASCGICALDGNACIQIACL